MLYSLTTANWLPMTSGQSKFNLNLKIVYGASFSPSLTYLHTHITSIVYIIFFKLRMLTKLEFFMIWGVEEITARGFLEVTCHSSVCPSTLRRVPQSKHRLYLFCCERYESELSLCQLVENDISGLRGILGEPTLCKSNLEAHAESLKDDLLCLKKNHEEVRKMAYSLKGSKSDKVKLVELTLCI